MPTGGPEEAQAAVGVSGFAAGAPMPPPPALPAPGMGGPLPGEGVLRMLCTLRALSRAALCFWVLSSQCAAAPLTNAAAAGAVQSFECAACL